MPYGGFVRTLSGAQRHDQLVIEAIIAVAASGAAISRASGNRGAAPSRPRPARIS